MTVRKEKEERNSWGGRKGVKLQASFPGAGNSLETEGGEDHTREKINGVKEGVSSKAPHGIAKLRKGCVKK